VAAFAEYLSRPHKGAPGQVRSVSIDSRGLIKGVPSICQRAHHLRQVHVVAHASAPWPDAASRKARRPKPQRLRWTLLKDRDRLSGRRPSDLDNLIVQAATSGRAGLALS